MAVRRAQPERHRIPERQSPRLASVLCRTGGADQGRRRRLLGTRTLHRHGARPLHDHFLGTGLLALGGEGRLLQAAQRVDDHRPAGQVPARRAQCGADGLGSQSLHQHALHRLRPGKRRQDGQHLRAARLLHVRAVQDIPRFPSRGILTMTYTSRFHVIRRVAAVAAVALVATACEMTVTNPGPIQDSALNVPAAIPALVNGMSGDLSVALGGYIDRGGLASGELTASGNYADEGFFYAGTFTGLNANTDWAAMQRARWTSESGIVRMKTVLGTDFESYVDTPRAYLYAGFANRLLGENVCTGVIDGGPALSDSVYFQRADSLFTRAYTLAPAQ